MKKQTKITETEVFAELKRLSELTPTGDRAGFTTEEFAKKCGISTMKARDLIRLGIENGIVGHIRTSLPKLTMDGRKWVGVLYFYISAKSAPTYKSRISRELKV